MTFTRAFKISLMAFAALFALASPAGAIVGGAKPHLDGVGRAVVVIVGSRGNFCSGAAIARDLVLTAAHCVLPGADYKIVRYQDGAKPALIDTAKIMRHPQFSLASLQGQRATADVALIKLAIRCRMASAPRPLARRVCRSIPARDSRLPARALRARATAPAAAQCAPSVSSQLADRARCKFV